MRPKPPKAQTLPWMLDVEWSGATSLPRVEPAGQRRRPLTTEPDRVAVPSHRTLGVILDVDGLALRIPVILDDRPTPFGCCSAVPGFEAGTFESMDNWQAYASALPRVRVVRRLRRFRDIEDVLQRRHFLFAVGTEIGEAVLKHHDKAKRGGDKERDPED
jgi:hypothetical protein